jgi:hypothetical protein
MTTEQKAAFEKRRLSVMRAHLSKDPKLRQYRRKRKRALVASVLGSLAVLLVALMLIKSFVILLEGAEGYAQIVAPILDSQSAGGVIVRALGPDPVSTFIVDIVRPIFSDRPHSGRIQGE